jgi:ribosome-binding protein aMBF1 (putative translation factor)
MEQETKVCKCCGRELPMSNFKKGRWGYVSVCMDCDKQHRAENRQTRIDKAKQKVEDVRAENRQLCLNDFTARELMAELKRRGYEGKLVYTETHTIDLSAL